MAKRAEKTDNATSISAPDSGPMKITWIRIVENPGPLTVPPAPPSPPVQRVYFQGIEDGATLPTNGHFLLSTHADWAKALVDSMADPLKFVAIKIDPALPTVTFQQHDYFLSSVVLSVPPVAGVTSVHGETVAVVTV